MKRKILACGMAMAMMLSANVFAQDPSITGDTTAVGGGQVGYVDTDITVVTLPATAPNFKLDPQGVVSAQKASQAQVDGGGAAFTDKDFAKHAADPANQGNIYSDVFQITNQGANDIEVSATFVAQITGDKTVIQKDGTAISNDTNNNVFMEIQFADAVAKGTADGTAPELKEPVFLENKKTSDTAEKIQFTAHANAKAKYNKKGQTVKLALPGDTTYGFKADGTYAQSVNITNAGDVNPSAQAYKITGKCNPKADWSSYIGGTPTDVIQLKVVYTVDKTDIDTEKAAGGAYNAVTGTIDTDGIVSYGDVAAATVTPATPTIKDTETLALTFTPGYNQEVLDTTYLEVGGVNVAADRYFSRGTYGTIDAVNNTITVTPAAFTYTGVTDNGTPGTYVVKVKDTAGTEYSVTVTVTP